MPEHSPCAGAGPIPAVVTLRQNMVKKIEILLHGIRGACKMGGAGLAATLICSKYTLVTDIQARMGKGPDRWHQHHWTGDQNFPFKLRPLRLY